MNKEYMQALYDLFALVAFQKSLTREQYARLQKYNDTIEQALERLDKYEEILGNGRLTDRNYKNTTLPLDSCKPYLRLGQLEDIYEEGKHNE